MSAPAGETWYRVVDAQHQGWHPTTGTVDGQTKYEADYGFKRDLPGRTLDDVERTRGPLRPVEPITDEDRTALEAALDAAGRKAIYTVAAAVYKAIGEVRELHGGLADYDSYETTRRQMLAGREGSWESEVLWDMAMWAGHGKASRIHEPSRQAITAMLVRWVTDPGRYTEVAETLAAVVSRYADEHDGWRAVADQWLQPGALDERGVRVTRGLLYSQSEHFYPDAE